MVSPFFKNLCLYDYIHLDYIHLDYIHLDIGNLYIYIDESNNELVKGILLCTCTCTLYTQTCLPIL